MMAKRLLWAVTAVLTQAMTNTSTQEHEPITNWATWNAASYLLPAIVQKVA